MADAFGQLSDREILVQIATDVGALKVAMYGDKRPGVLEQTATLTSRLDVYDEIYSRSLADQKPLLREWEQYKHAVDDLKAEGVTGKERKAVWAGLLTSMGIALAGFLSAWNATPK